VAVAALTVVFGWLAVSCGTADTESMPRWTVRQAESISTIRGMRVRVRQCRGLGEATSDGGSRRFRRFACVAGARREGEAFDTVGVFYDLRPLGEYDGPSSRHALANVRFIGGPGIP
jgi:hypothetical protein